MIKGTSVERGEYSKKVGFLLSNVIAINPTKAELIKLGISAEKDPEYIKEYHDKEQDVKYPEAVITVWYAKVETGELYPHRFSIVNRVRRDKDDTKGQYINDLGQTAWATDPNDFNNDKWNWWTKRSYRKALQGDQEFYDFLRNWLSLDDTDPETEYKIDYKKLFAGNFRELQDIVETFKKQTVVCNAIIHVKIFTEPDDNGDIPKPAHYQNLWKEFLPGSAMRYLVNSYTKAVPTWIYNPKYDPTKPTNKDNKAGYINRINGEHGSKDYFITTPENCKAHEMELRDYNELENPVTNPLGQHTGVNEPVGDLLDLPF